MIVDVDIGNSRIKWRVQQGALEALELPNWQHMFPRLPEGIERIRVSNVAGAAIESAFASECRSRLALEPQFARPRHGVGGITLAYTRTETLGADRWLAMLAARQRTDGEAFVVFCAGTALTADLVTREGYHLGGFIIPGLQMSINALLAGARQLSAPAALLKSDWQPGQSTADCIQGGLSALYQGFLQQIQYRAQQSLTTHQRLMTGGSAGKLLSLLGEPCDFLLCETLVLDGLQVGGVF